MMNLDTVATRFAEMARGILPSAGPSRDELARELAELEANPPGFFVDICAPVPAAEHATCEGCRAAGADAIARRAVYMNHSAALDRVRARLFRMSCGGPDELDRTGHELTRLRGQIRAARDEHDRRRWGEWDEEPDPERPGKSISTWISPAVLGQITLDLADLARKVGDELSYCSIEEARAGLEQARRRLAEIMARPIRVPIDAERAAAAQIPKRDFLDDSGGLMPSPGDPSILGGTVRFRRRADRPPPPPEPSSAESLAPQEEDAP